jgi:hypothetical protein
MVFPVESFPLSLDQARVMGVDGVLANDLAGALHTFR